MKVVLFFGFEAVFMPKTASEFRCLDFNPSNGFVTIEQGPTKTEIACKGLVYRRSKRSFHILNMICGTCNQSIKAIDI